MNMGSQIDAKSIKLFKYYKNGSLNLSKIDKKARLRRGCVSRTFWGGVPNGWFREPKSSTYHQNGSQNRSRINEKSPLQCGRVFGTTIGRQVTPRATVFGTHLTTIFDQKSKKWHTKRHPKIDAEKVSKNYEKSIQNEVKIDAKIIYFHVFSKKVKNRKSRSRCSESMVF